MDVHPPHEPIHSWRDFILHLVTITIGLLIALGLEAAVENMHHKHVVREARENIRHELELNHQAAKSDLDNLDTNKKNMQHNLATLRSLRKDLNTKGLDAKYQFDWSSFNESAWLSARDSGALTYMPIDEVQRYADLYMQQDVATSQAVTIFSSEVEVAAPFMEEADQNISKEQINGMLHDTAVTYMRLSALQQIVDQLDRSYLDALKK